MAFNEELAGRIRKALNDEPSVVEKKMFGGLAFMVNGHMCCGVTGDQLMARVGPERYENALEQAHAREMDFTGKPLRGFVYVSSEGIASDSELSAWIDRALGFVRTLPTK